jgi:hypothetical protein
VLALCCAWRLGVARVKCGPSEGWVSEPARVARCGCFLFCEVWCGLLSGVFEESSPVAGAFGSFPCTFHDPGWFLTAQRGGCRVPEG